MLACGMDIPAKYVPKYDFPSERLKIVFYTHSTQDSLSQKFLQWTLYAAHALSSPAPVPIEELAESFGLDIQDVKTAIQDVENVLKTHGFANKEDVKISPEKVQKLKDAFIEEKLKGNSTKTVLRDWDLFEGNVLTRPSLSYEELAMMHDMTPDAVKSNIGRTIDILEKHFNTSFWSIFADIKDPPEMPQPV